MKILSHLFVAILLSTSIFSQDKTNAKFGKVSPEDFATKAYSVDSNANAVVIADIGSSKIVGNNKGWFSLEFKRYCRIRLLNKNGFDAATEEIPLYSEGEGEEKVSNIKAVTYNLQDGKVVETGLDTKNNIFKDKINKNLIVKKFTFPNIKEGSIIEFEYTITSDYLRNLQPWAFQGDYPVLWSEYNLTLPSFFNYVFLSQGFQQFFINTKKQSTSNFSVIQQNGVEASNHIYITGDVTDYRWVIKDAPALKEEAYVSTVKNHIQKIEFELTSQSDPLEPHVYLSTWPQMADDLNNDEDFGLTLSKDYGWLGDVLKPVVAGATQLEKAKKIYAYVRDNFTCTDYSEKWLRQSLKNVVKAKSGTVAEINLLLTAMLRYEGIEAYPVILSTRSHGYVYALYPILNKFNYVICDAIIDGKQIFLDATRSRLGFGRLTPDCYNGHAKIINAYASDIMLLSDSLIEKKVTSIILNTNEKGEMVGTLQQVPGYFESHEIREKVKEKGKDEFFKEVKKAYGQDVELITPRIDSLDDLDENIAIAYDFKLNEDKQDLIYVSPMFGEGYKENPFKSAERLYPVEMPYAMDETYVFSMFIPEGYVVDELPKSVVVKLNADGDGEFEYRLSQSGNMISMRSRIQLKRAYYQPAEYQTLREFFNMIVKKQSEQIVLRKKK